MSLMDKFLAKNNAKEGDEVQAAPSSVNPLVSELQRPGPRLRSEPVSKLSAPLNEMGICITLDQLRPYDNNPRTERNPKYDEIKASIREVGLKHPPVITQRPGDDKFMVSDGGNTRLAILNELYQETGEERFFAFWCVYRPWISEKSALAGHLSENENRADLTWIEKALGLVQLKEMLEAEEGQALSQRELARRCMELGFSVDHSHISRMLYTVEHIWPSLPLTLRSGMGRPQIKIFINYREALLEIWKRAEAKPVEEFDTAFHELISKFDYEDQTELPWDSLVKEHLIEMMAEQTGAPDRTIQVTLQDYLHYRKHRRPIDDKLWTPLDRAMERVRDPEAHPMEFFPPLPDSNNPGDLQTQDPDTLPVLPTTHTLGIDHPDQDSDKHPLPEDQEATPSPIRHSAAHQEDEAEQRQRQQNEIIERVRAENARIQQSLHHATEPQHPVVHEDTEEVNCPDPRTDEEKRSSLTLSPVTESSSYRQTRHYAAQQAGGEAGDFEDFAVKAIPIMTNGPLMPVTDLWWIDTNQVTPPTLRYIAARMAQAIGQWADFPLASTPEIEAPIQINQSQGIGYDLFPLPPELEAQPRAQQVWQLLAALQGELQPIYPTELTLLGDLVGTTLGDPMPDEVLIRLFRLIRVVRVLHSLPAEEHLEYLDSTADTDNLE